MCNFRSEEVPVWNQDIQAPRVDVYIHSRGGFVESGKERVEKVHQDRHGQELPRVSVAREDEVNVLPHDCFHGRPGLVGHHYGGDALTSAGQRCVQIHAVRTIAVWAQYYVT